MTDRKIRYKNRQEIRCDLFNGCVHGYLSLTLMPISYQSRTNPSCAPRFAYVNGAVFRPNTMLCSIET